MSQFFFGRHNLKSARSRTRQIDRSFQHLIQSILVIYTLFVFIIWISERDFLRVNGVAVSGAHAINGDLVSQIAMQELAKPFFYHIGSNNIVLYPKQTITQNIAAMDARIANVSVGLDSGNLLVIHIDEYTPAILACDGTGAATSSESAPCYFGDEKGYVFAAAPIYAGNPFLRFYNSASSTELNQDPKMVGKFVMSQDDFLLLTNFLRLLDQSGYRVNSVESLSGHDLRLMTDSGWDVLWSTRENPEGSVRDLSAVLSSLTNEHGASITPHLIDLRFGNKIFYK